MKFAIYLLSIILLLNIITSNSILSSFQNFKKDTLDQDQRIGSNNGKYFAIMQGDGNFVLYSVKGQNGRNRDFPIWASNTNNKPRTAPVRVVMQHDGNAVLYDSKNKVLWASNSNGKGRPPYNLVMQDDGNLVLYDTSNSPKWASNTNGKK